MFADEWRVIAVRNECEGTYRLSENQIGQLSDGDRAAELAHSHCVGPVYGAGVEGLGGGEPHPYAALRHNETHISGRRRSGVVVARESQSEAGADEVARATVREPQEE